MSIDIRQRMPARQRLVVPTEPIWQLSVAQYQDMVRAGILTDDDPIELLEGLLVPKMPKNPPHRLSTQLLREALAQLLPPGWHINDQEPIATDDSEPEPDLSVIRGARRDYVDRHPAPADVGIVIEVADTTLQRDRTLKKRLYARAGIMAYWIINLAEQQVEIYTAPSGPSEQPDYAQRNDIPLGAAVTLLLDGTSHGEIAVAAILP